MSLRLKGLTSIDPLSVPLPHGTEVTTRVDRQLDERRIPAGAVGRVVGTREGNLFEVLVPGAGTALYAREELLPRKAGQARYARRRDAAWGALRPCVVLEAVVGSRAWGLAHEGSDTDERGVFALPLPWTFGLADPPRDLVSADGSATFWEIGKAVRQALRADPNTLELLFVPTARALDPIGEWLLHERDAFVSAEIYGTFGRYALSQLTKLSRAQRLAAHRAVILDWLRAEEPPPLDEVARRLARLAPRGAPSVGTRGLREEDAVLSAKEYVKQLYRSLFDQGRLPASDYASLIRYAREGGDLDLGVARELRPKNAYNLLRLLAVATEWLQSGSVDLVVRGPLRDRLLAIKQGEVPLDDVLAEAEAMTADLEAARQGTKLPRKADVVRADRLLRKIGEELARRFAGSAPGPFGRDAPPPPELDWSDDDEAAAPPTEPDE